MCERPNRSKIHPSQSLIEWRWGTRIPCWGGAFLSATCSRNALVMQMLIHAALAFAFVEPSHTRRVQEAVPCLRPPHQGGSVYHSSVCLPVLGECLSFVTTGSGLFSFSLPPAISYLTGGAGQDIQEDSSESQQCPGLHCHRGGWLVRAATTCSDSTACMLDARLQPGHGGNLRFSLDR